MYLRRLLLVILLAGVSAYFTGAFFDYRYKRRMEYYVFDKMAVATTKNEDFDLIYLGNSMVHSGINPYYVDSITGLKSYNLAIGACDEEEMKLLTTVYLQHHQPPTYAVIGVDKSMLVKYNILHERFPYLFYLDNDTVYSYLNRNGFPTGLIKAMPFFKYSFFDEYNRTAVFIRGNRVQQFDHNIYNGFINGNKTIAPDTVSVKPDEQSMWRELPQSKKINDSAATTFMQTVSLLQSKGTHVIFLFPPRRINKRLQNEEFEQLNKFFLDLAVKSGIPVLRTDTSSQYSNEYFCDNYHMNEPGSRILSVQVANFIRNNLKGN